VVRDAGKSGFDLRHFMREHRPDFVGLNPLHCRSQIVTLSFTFDVSRRILYRKTDIDHFFTMRQISAVGCGRH
jgi:hypothetical protein